MLSRKNLHRVSILRVDANRKGRLHSRLSLSRVCMVLSSAADAALFLDSNFFIQELLSRVITLELCS